MFDLQQAIASEQLKRLDTDTRLIIVHPNYIKQRLLLHALILDDSVVYLRFDGLDLKGDEVRRQMNAALIDQMGDASYDGVCTVVLDECDRVDEHALAEFVQHLAAVLFKSNKTRIVLISRSTPHTILNRDEWQPITSIVPVDEELMLCDYARNGEERALLEVQSFGSGRVFLNGRLIDHWDGLLPRSLFFYLVDRGMTTRNDIFKIFWSNLTTREATNVFHVTKRKISEVLGVDLTVYWAGFYRISPDIELNYDAMQFNKLVQDSAVAPDDEASQMLHRAVELYRGPFLSSIDIPWANERRQAMLQTYSEALVSLAKMAEADKDFQRALGLYLRASRANPQREDLVQSIMGLYQDMNMPQDALMTYDRLAQELEASLGVAPAPQLRELAETLRPPVS